jgi:hypothetical protein
MYKDELAKILFIMPIILTNLESTSLEPDTVIAEIEGEKILYKEISAEEIKDTVLNVEEKELQFLAKKVENIVKLKECEKRSIKVSEDEVKEKINSMFKYAAESTGMNEEEIAKYVSNKAKIIVDALKRLQKDPTQSESIFNNFLKGKISYEEWEAYKKIYNSDEKIRNFEKSIPNSVEDMKRFSYKSKYERLLYQKLFNAITENIKVSEGEIKEYYTWKYPPIEYFEVLHIFCKEDSILKGIIGDIKKSIPFIEALKKYNLNNNGGYKKETYFLKSLLPFYAKDIYNLKEKEFGKIYYGILVKQMDDGTFREIKDEGNYYHVIQLSRIIRENAKVPLYDEVRIELENELLKEKKEQYYENWLKETLNKVKIHIFIDKYKKVLQLLK